MTQGTRTERPSIPTPPPPPLDLRPVRSVVRDVRRARAVRRTGGLPPGSHELSIRNAWRLVHDPLPLLLEHYERYGPVFTIRTMHDPVVWGIGPEVNQRVLVTEPDAFCLRDGQYVDLAPLFGDGLLLTDGSYPKEIRRVILPTFQKDRLVEVMDIAISEAAHAADTLPVEVGVVMDIDEWVRETILTMAVRVIFGLGVDRERDHRLRVAFEEVAGMWGRLFVARLLALGRWPGSPYNRAVTARDELDRVLYTEINARRAAGEGGPGMLGLLVDCTDGAGDPLPPRMIRDQLMTLLFGGHDTSAGALSLLLYELGRNPGPRLDVERELDEKVAGRCLTATDLDGSTLPVLERTIDETLRRYPTAWAGPRRTTRPVEVHGVEVPGGVSFNYSAWVTHHLSEYYEDPLAFRPDRFLPENRSALPRGAYIPFGGGARICVGMRLAKLMLRATAATLLTRVRIEPDPASPLRIGHLPTLGPIGGMRCRVHRREQHHLEGNDQ